MKKRFGISVVALLGIALLAEQQLIAQRPAPDGDQERIRREVNHELVMLPYYTVFDNLEYKVDGYAVTLMGQVTRPTLKSDAETAVKKIEGVEKVTNQIEVLPPSPADDRIRLAAYFALFNQDSPLFRYGQGAVPPIHIVVKNGRLTLVGLVNNTGDKTIAGMRVSGIPGVFSVTNNLKVAAG